jgi:hypothetical protein
MDSPAEGLFNSLNKYEDIEKLIANGEVENLYLECKAPTVPQLNKDLRAKLAQALSGFANTNGGVIVWGVSTTLHTHSHLDVLSQIEPIANCSAFAKEIDVAIPTLTMPSILCQKSKVFIRNEADTRGVIATLIPPRSGDPVQSNIDNVFYFRNGDKFVLLPYKMLEALFKANRAPDIILSMDNRLLSKSNDHWKIPILLQNNSTAVGEHVTVSVNLINHEDCVSITAEGFNDASSVNPGYKIFNATFNKVLHRGLNVVSGAILVKPKENKTKLNFEVSVYANNMRAKKFPLEIVIEGDKATMNVGDVNYFY